MVALGSLLALIGGSFLLSRFYNRDAEIFESPLFLKAVVFCTPLGFLAIESGWVVTELGRQPWIVYGIMKTSEAVTPMPGLIYPMMLFTGIYLVLAFLVGILISRQFLHVA
jgi:cytochrome d ubiquinol oxidase subunit I